MCNTEQEDLIIIITFRFVQLENKQGKTFTIN